MPMVPVIRYRPSKTDMHGSFAETLADPIIVWGGFKLYEGKMQFSTDAKNPIEIGDILEVDTSQF